MIKLESIMEPRYKEKIARLFYSRTNEDEFRIPLVEELWRDANFESALDVGPGPGTLTRCLATRTRQLAMVEINGDYEAALRSQFPDARIAIGSIEDFDVRRHAWDQVLLSHVLYYLDEPQWFPLCARLHSGLAQRGALVIILNADRGNLWDLLEGFRRKSGGRLQFGLLPSSEFGHSLQSLGPVSVRPYTYQVFYDSIEGAVEFIGRQLLEIADVALFELHRSEFEAAARERVTGDQVVFEFHADLMVVGANDQKAGNFVAGRAGG